MTKEEAIQELAEMFDLIDGNVEVRAKKYKALNMAIEALRQPEQKKGRWISNGTVCLNCYHRFETNGSLLHCPNCRARMEEEE